MLPTERRFLVTGAHGCIGAWVVRELLDGGHTVTTFDLSAEPRRIRLLLDEGATAAVRHVVGDITDLAVLEATLDEEGITNVIHLAALQVPFCRADPPLGTRVNVLGTVNVFEAVKRRRREAVGHVVYASSIAALDTKGTLCHYPGTLYGAFKRANEAVAAVYFADDGVSSVGLRPHTVYGVGRDQGLTSAPTIAMLAAAADVPYTIPYGGAAQLQFAQDVARAFVAASLATVEGASVHSLPGRAVSMQEVINAITDVVPESVVDFDEVALPFPADAESSSFLNLVPAFAETPLQAGVAETVERFRALLAAGLVTPPARAAG